jgi:phosphoglycerate dehydrogenase-like enzyme
LDCHVWLRLGRELPGDGLNAFAGQFPNVKFTAAEVPEDSGAVNIVFTNKPLPDETTRQLSALKWIHTTYGGGASYRTALVAERGIIVTSSRGVQSVALAEFTEAAVLALAKRFPVLWRFKQERRWDETLPLNTLSGQVVGLLGLGAMGSLVAKRLRGHGMRVHAIRRNLSDVPPYVDSVSGWDRLRQILAEADFLIVALPASKELQGRLSESEFRSMKPSSYLINLVTRGIVPDAALATALRAGWIAGAACNVFETNPLPQESPLWEEPNLIISPNVAQGDPHRWEKLREIFTGNLERYLTGGDLMNVVGDKGAY